MKCRICGADGAARIGRVEYYEGYAWDVHDCAACGSRFTRHDPSVYAWLHAQAGSSYGNYRSQAGAIKALFDAGDVAGLRAELERAAKFRFAIGALERLPRGSRVLEVGCSRGYLTAYFVKAGFDVTGADVAGDALADARRDFGNHFVQVEDVLAGPGSYDAICHVGTIGCVADPLGLTTQLLGLLRPGGVLAFNAPNAQACALPGQLWLDEAPPPDLVTLFRPGFWTQQFSAQADVAERIEALPAEQGLRLSLLEALGRRWEPPLPAALGRSLADYQRSRSRTTLGPFWRLAERVLAKVAGNGPSRHAAPFGLLVTMTRKGL